jgi:NTE family protein
MNCHGCNDRFMTVSIAAANVSLFGGRHCIAVSFSWTGCVMASVRSQHSSAAHPRVGLVLGAGGVLGAAWMAGAFPALEERLGFPLADAGLIVGTSAGSVMAAALRCGASADAIVTHQRGGGGVPTLGDFDRESGPFPPVPRLRLGSTRLLMRAVRAPGLLSPWVVASALLPEGRAHHDGLTALLQAVVARADGHLVRGSRPWPRDPTWIMCIDYDTGERVAFGQSGARTASLPDAVVASCSIPGWHQPKLVDGHRYVDAGVISTTSLELITQSDVDEAYVLAPMASYQTDRPRHPAARAERLLRHFYTQALNREAAKVRATGVKVTVLTPGPDDLSAIGGNLMDPSRREAVLEASLQTTPSQIAALAGRWPPSLR